MALPLRVKNKDSRSMFKISMFKKKSLVSSLIILLCLSGCALVAAPLDSLSKSGWSPESRKGLHEK